MTEQDYKGFYDERRGQTYAHDYNKMVAHDHPYFEPLREFIDRYDLKNKRCLEIGSSGGFFQDMVDDYWGTDIADTLAKHYHKPYRVAGPAGTYPFDDQMFDAIWTITVYEHIPELQTAMREIDRMLKPGGVVFFAPAWQCRTWAADGYNVRPYRDFGIGGRLIKASIPVRDSIAWRSAFIFPKRAARLARYLMGHRYRELPYKKIRANYETYWASDSDACNHIDPHDAILWFESNGFECLSHPTMLSAFFVRTGVLTFRKRNDQSQR
jgi:SAM-dependent methyltransferase